MKMLQALWSGAAGAITVTALNESVRQLVPHAPRVEVIGMRALAAALRASGKQPPEDDELYGWTLAGDLLSNSLYYSLVGVGETSGAWRRGALLGLAGGLGAALLPGPLGLGRQPGERPPLTQILTVAWYLAGGLAAAATYRASATTHD